MNLYVTFLVLAQSTGASKSPFPAEMGVYLTVAGVGLVIAIVGLVLRKPLSGQMPIPGWLAGGVVGVLIGFGIGGGLMFGLGYHWSPQPIVVQQMTGPPMGGVMAGQGGANRPKQAPGPGMMPAAKKAGARKAAGDAPEKGTEKSQEGTPKKSETDQ